MTYYDIKTPIHATAYHVCVKKNALFFGTDWNAQGKKNTVWYVVNLSYPSYRTQPAQTRIA